MWSNVGHICGVMLVTYIDVGHICSSNVGHICSSKVGHM